MSNPAKELLELIDLWDSRSGVIFNRRKPEDRNDPIGQWEETLQAEKLILEIWDFYETTMGGIKNVESNFVELIRWVHQPADNWGSNNYTALSSLVREWLSTVATLIDSTKRDFTQVPSSATIDYLRRSFEEILKCVGDTPEKLGSLKYVVWNNAKRGLDCLNSSPIDHLELREICFSFIGAFAALIIIDGGFKEGVDKHFSNAGGIREFFSNFIGHVGLWFSNSTSGAAGNVIAAHLPDIIGLLGG